MVLGVPLATGATLSALAGLMACAIGLVLLAGQGTRATRIFAFLLLAGGLGEVLFWGVRMPLPNDPLAVTQGSAASVYFLLGTLVLLPAFALYHPTPRGTARQRRAALLALAAAGLALELAYALDHGLYVRGGDGLLFRGGVPGPLYYVRLLEPLMFPAVALLFALDVRRGRARAHEGTLLLFAVVFTIEWAYGAPRSLIYALAGFASFAPGNQSTPLALVPIAALLVVLWRHGAASTGRQRFAARAAAGGVVVGLAGGVFTGLVVAYAPQVEAAISGLPYATFALAAPALLGYGLLRLRHADLDLRLKRAIPGTAVAGSFLVVFAVANEAGRGSVGAATAPYLGFAAVLAMLVGLPRLRRAGRHLAERAMPGVNDGTTYLNVRRLEVYRAALEEAHADPAGPSPRERERLAALRAELGLTERDHALLEYAVLAAHGALPQRPLEAGEVVLGRYRVVRTLGEGANGTTYLAQDGDREVALKLLRPERTSDPDVLREARALQAVRHPRVVRIHDVAHHAGQGLLVMEYVEGGSLEARLAAGPLEQAAFARVGKGLLEALGAVHEVGLVHRDVKPSNVLLTAEGEAKLADFGVAYLPGLETTMGSGDLAHAVGTIRFMSPEQARGRRVSPRSDLFSAAATLYEAWTGQPYLAPRQGESSVELQLRAAAGVAFPKGFKGPPALRAWFARALDPRPEKRFADARAMAAALEAALPAAWRRAAGTA